MILLPDELYKGGGGLANSINPNQRSYYNLPNSVLMRQTFYNPETLPDELRKGGFCLI